MQQPDQVKRNAIRTLAALYRLSKGRPGIPVSRTALESEMRSESVLDLTDEQFTAYQKRAVSEVHAAQLKGAA